MLKTMLVIAALSSATAFAAGDSDARLAAKQVIELQDGSLVYVFDNGNMALENKYGIAVRTEPGTELRAKDGSTVTMAGDDVARLDILLRGSAGPTNHP